MAVNTGLLAALVQNEGASARQYAKEHGLDFTKERAVVINEGYAITGRVAARSYGLMFTQKGFDKLSSEKIDLDPYWTAFARGVNLDD